MSQTAKTTEEFNAYWNDYLNKPIIDHNEIGKALRQAKQLEERVHSESHSLKRMVLNGMLTFEVNPDIFSIKEIGKQEPDFF
jgi:hypothetical protein